ncbi:hypothetical protein RJT34_13185 [Clitoria ternatea]|uniref:Uncharacterized protein n=1 Tax=Clitoria ternatea TaxID=43366 RepID=A0AAN9PLL0_CLITE
MSSQYSNQRVYRLHHMKLQTPRSCRTSPVDPKLVLYFNKTPSSIPNSSLESSIRRRRISLKFFRTCVGEWWVTPPSSFRWFGRQGKEEEEEEERDVKEDKAKKVLERDQGLVKGSVEGRGIVVRNDVIDMNCCAVKEKVIWLPKNVNLRFTDLARIDYGEPSAALVSVTSGTFTASTSIPMTASGLKLVA